MTTVITGLFNSPQDAALAVHTLDASGFAPGDISIVAGERFDREAFGIDSHTKLPEGAAIGAGTGGAVGAVAAGLTAVGAVATGGGFLVAGPLVASLAGAGAGAAAGSVLGGLVGLAIPEHEVKFYEDAIENGSVLVGIECADSDAKDRAKQVFEKCETEKVSTA